MVREALLVNCMPAGSKNDDWQSFLQEKQVQRICYFGSAEIEKMLLFSGLPMTNNACFLNGFFTICLLFLLLIVFEAIDHFTLISFVHSQQLFLFLTAFVQS
jgi:hypothetical protein